MKFHRFKHDDGRCINLGNWQSSVKLAKDEAKDLGHWSRSETKIQTLTINQQDSYQAMMNLLNQDSRVLGQIHES